MKERRGHWYLLTGLIIGLSIGLAFAWIIQPVKYVDTAPHSLRADFKDLYRVLIASAYVANGDVVRARARLELLKDEDVYQTLAEQAQRTLAEKGSAEEARALGLLAIAIGKTAPGAGAAITQVLKSPTATVMPSSPTVPPTHTWTPPPTDTATFTPLPTTAQAIPSLEELSSITEVTPDSTLPPRQTDTPIPTHTPSPTPGGPFVLLSREKMCEQKLSQPLIIIEAFNAMGQPAPGILVIVTWAGGEERFYTGLKPEKGLGYADFIPMPGIYYTIRLGESGEPVLNISAAECQSASGENYWGIWLMKFAQI